MQEKGKPENSEDFSNEQLAEMLRQLYPTVRTKEKKPYSKSALINLRSGLNRYLTSPRNNRIINLMKDEFLVANKVFKGKICIQKQNICDVSSFEKKVIIDKDAEKTYGGYFRQAVNTNSTVLQHKCILILHYISVKEEKKA